MSATDVMRVRLARLLHEIGLDRSAFDKKLDEVALYRPTLGESSPPGRPVTALVAMDLHDAYTALETIRQRLRDALDRFAEAVRHTRDAADAEP